MFLRLLPVLMLVAACGSETTHDSDSDVAALEVTAVAVIGSEPVACGQTYPSLGASERSMELADARVFLSGFQARDAEGAWVDVDLPGDGMWQRDGVVLLDFEDGTAGCSDSGTAALNSTFTADFPVDGQPGLRFTVGVPFELNHNDNATSPAPLNIAGMFWNWQGGYKFIRTDFFGSADEGPARWNVHLGSTGCVSDAPTQGPTEECGRPNRATITLSDFDPSVHSLQIDLGALIEDADLSFNQPDTPPGCMSAPTEPEDCGPVFDSLGLSFETGQCVQGCEGQRVFSAVDR